MAINKMEKAKGKCDQEKQKAQKTTQTINDIHVKKEAYTYRNEYSCDDDP